MPRRRDPPRLYPRTRPGRRGVWVVLDGAREISTGASLEDLSSAEEFLRNYLSDKHEPPSGATAPKDLYVAEIVSIYLKEHAPTTRSPAWILYMATPIVEWWGTKKLAEINKLSCSEYVRWRTTQFVKQQKKGRALRRVSDQTARHELSILSAAVNYFNESKYGPLDALPVVSLPAKAQPREDYFLTRTQIAERILVARRRPETRHVARAILIGFYTGTRPGAVLKTRWLQSTDGGWFDLDAGILHRKPQGRAETAKRQPKVRIHRKLMVHLRYWKARDLERGIVSVVHYQGQAIRTKLRRSWDTVRRDAGHDRKDGPHILRHSCATWLMERGISKEEAADYLGMTPDTLWETYRHHHPNWQSGPAQVMPKK